MYMSTSSIKKVSAAAIAAVLGLSGMALAAPIALPYQTTFSTTPDSNGDTYTGGAAALQGQGNTGPTDSTSTGWVNENGEQNDTASVTNSATSGTVTLSSSYTPLVLGVPTWSDVENANLADHPAAPGNGNGVPLNSASYGSNITASFNLNVLGTGSLNAGGEASAAFGARVLDSSDNLLAALFVKGNPSVPGEIDVYTQSGTDNAQITSLTGPANNTLGTYAIHLDFQNGDFQVFVNGFESADIPFGTGETGVTQIGGISLATDNLGTNTGVFSDFSVVPEPASFAMIGLGGLMLLAKRPKRTA